MNILLCTSRMGIGGAETHILTLAEELTGLGHCVCVVSSGGAYTALLEKSGIRHVTLPLDSRTPLKLIRSYYGLIRLAESFGADIVHAHGRIPAFVCGLCQRFSPFPPFVTTAHGLYDSREPLRSLSDWGCAAIAVSREVESYLNNVYGLSHDEVTFIPNGVRVPDTNLYRTYKAAELVISASARMDYDNEEAFLLLLSVFEALRGSGKCYRIKLKLAGSGACFDKIKAEADRINSRFPGSVTMTGAVTDAKAFLAGSSIFVGQSRSALEAMAMGIPTVLFNSAGCASVLTPANSDYLYGRNYIPDVSDNNHKRLTDALIMLLDSHDFRLRVSDYSYSYVKEHNSLDDTVASTLRFYRNTLDKLKSGVLLCGYFGAGNTGDELTLRTVAEKIKKAVPGAEISVITRDKKRTPPGLTGIGRTDFRTIKRAVRQSRVLVLCGGSLIQNFTSTRSLLYYSKMCRNARKAGCRLMIWGGGIGPVSGFDGEEMAASLLSSLSAAGLRDGNSLKEAERFGCRTAYLSSDSVLSSGLIQTGPVLGDGNFLTVCPRKLKRFRDRKKLFSVLSAAVTEICRDTGMRPRFVPLAPEDSEICARLASVCKGLAFRPDTPANTAKLIGESRVLIAVRLHSAILAFRASVPFAAISYDPKVTAFSEETSAPCLELEILTVRSLVDAVELLPLTDNKEKIREFALRARKDEEAFTLIYDYKNTKDNKDD